MLFSGFLASFCGNFLAGGPAAQPGGVDAFVLFHAADDELQRAAGVEHCNLHLHARCCV